MAYYLGIDLGGTNIAAGIVDDQYRILVRETVETKAPRPVEELVGDIAALCRRLVARQGLAIKEIHWVGIGTPGVVWDRVICYSSNLQLYSAPLAALMERELELPLYLQNDANTAAYGEYVAGAGCGCRSMAIITIGTGIGSGIILNGKIHLGFNGAAAELGHVSIQPGGRLCSCGKYGCVEPYCSAKALAKSAEEAMRRHPESSMWQLCGGDIGKLSAKIPFAAMRLGDSIATEVVEEFIHYLAITVAITINILQPEVFCIGGGVSREGEYITIPLRREVENMTFSGRDGLRTRIVTATLGNDAGIIGAAMLGKLPE